MGKVGATVPAVLGVLTIDWLISFPVGTFLECQTVASRCKSEADGMSAVWAVLLKPECHCKAVRRPAHISARQLHMSISIDAFCSGFSETDIEAAPRAAGLAAVAAGLLTWAGERVRNRTPHFLGGGTLRSSVHPDLPSPASGSAESTLQGSCWLRECRGCGVLALLTQAVRNLLFLALCCGPRFCRPALGCLQFPLSGVRQTNLLPSH